MDTNQPTDVDIKKPTGFNDLSGELRNEIYHHIIHHVLNLTGSRVVRWQKAIRHGLAILQTSHRVRTEMLSMLQNKLHIYIFLNNTNTAQKFLDFIASTYDGICGMIRSLSIGIDEHCRPGQTTFSIKKRRAGTRRFKVEIYNEDNISCSGDDTLYIFRRLNPSSHEVVEWLPMWRELDCVVGSTSWGDDRVTKEGLLRLAGVVVERMRVEEGGL
jgi:hypothetical protein